MRLLAYDCEERYRTAELAAHDGEISPALPLLSPARSCRAQDRVP